MNYIELINQFWAKDAEYQFSANETAFYFYLLNMCNSARWRNPFGLSNTVAIAKFGWGKASFVRARNRLKEAGLIDFRAGVGRGNIYRYLVRDQNNPDVANFEKVIQPDLFSAEGAEKPAQSDTFCEQLPEKECGKGTQTDTFFHAAPGKGIQTGAFSVALLGREYEKGVQTEPFLKQFSENGIGKGTQTDPFYCPKPQKNQVFQKPLNNNISNIFKDKDIIENKVEKSKNPNLEKTGKTDKNQVSVNEKTVKEKEKKSAQKEKEVLALYLTVCVSFPKILQLTAGRKDKILRRLSEMGGMKILEQVFKKMEASDFLKGKNQFGWKASFDWVFKNPDNWMKVLEGNYDNRAPQTNIFKPANDARFMGMLQTDINKF